MKTPAHSLSLSPFRELLHRPNGQLPALDALRTLAVALVVFTHATSAYLSEGGSPSAFSRFPLIQGGWIGVDLFFVLSGYFIGRQLWRELKQTGTISFRAFVLRRGLRIWPLYFFFLFFVLVVLGRGGGSAAIGWSDAAFLTNYVNQGVVMGSWSLCTEEQFYIITPLLMVLGALWIRSLEGYRKYLMGLLILLPVIRALIWWWQVGDFKLHDQNTYFYKLYTPFHTHCDGLIVGLLLANWEVARGEKAKTGARASFWWIPVSLVILVLMHRLQSEVFAFTGVALVFGSMVWYLLCNRPAWLRFLEFPGFFLFSRLSFGMYLNHEYMHSSVATFVLKYLPFASAALNNLVACIVLFLLSAAVSVVTFCVIEHPFLLLRERMLGRLASRSMPPKHVPIPSPANPAEVPGKRASEELRDLVTCGSAPTVGA